MAVSCSETSWQSGQREEMIMIMVAKKRGRRRRRCEEGRISRSGNATMFPIKQVMMIHNSHTKVRLVRMGEKKNRTRVWPAKEDCWPSRLALLTLLLLSLAGSNIVQSVTRADSSKDTGPTALALLAPSGGEQANYANTRPPPTRTVNPGDRVNIPCSLANLGGSIQFAKDDTPIVLDSGCQHCQLDISNEGQASLTINRVSARDQGHWQCWRLDAAGKVKQKIPIMQLAISNSPELPILFVNDKELLGGNGLDATATVKENELVAFKCLIKGAQTPVDYVHWMLDSSQNVTQQSELLMEYSPQDNHYLTQSVLKLNATKAMNLKSVSCLSNHQLWLTPMTVTAFLNVLYEPSFTISREPGFGVSVSEGMTVILKCEIDSNPPSSPIWLKDADNKTSEQSAAREAVGEPLLLDTQDDGSVIFQPAQRTDSGWYRCKTENKYGNFSSFGYYLNVRSAGTSASATVAPPASLPGQQAPPAFQQRPRPQESAVNPHYPRIMGPNQAAAQTGGRYSSMINNDQPATMNPQVTPPTSHAIRAEGFPEMERPVSTVSAILGRPLTLPLRFCCNPAPTHVFWIHRHLAMIPGRMFGPYITREIYPTYNSFYCYESTFEIEAVKPEDIGTVYAFVSNEKGHAGAQIHIQLAKDQGYNSRFQLASSAETNHATTATNYIILIALTLIIRRFSNR